jgi:hypothetical protein
MASKRTAPAKPEPAASPLPLPLFYREPQILTAAAHGGLQLRRGGDFRFAAATNAAPIMAVEFVEAQHAYPIVFVGEPAHPAAVLGLARDNLFVSAEGGWAVERYIPAYVRRYPFVFIETADRAHYALGLDLASERVARAGEDGEGLIPLFQDGQPTQLVQDALQFCTALQASQQDTRAFCDALLAHDLLIAQQAHGAFPDGTPFNLQGFRVIDADRFANLPDAVVVEWHRKGWLALVHHHLASLKRWRELLDRQAATSARPAAA